MSGNSKHAGHTVISKISSILLAVIEGNGQRLAEIAAAAQLPLSTAHRLVTELVDWRVLERDAHGEFRVGAALCTGSSCPGSSCPASSCSGARWRPLGDADPAETLRVRAAPIMEDVFRVTAMPVRVGFLVGVQVAYIEKSVAFRPVSRHLPAARLPAHATALGKVLVAYSPPAVADAVLATPLRRYTPRTVAGPEEFRSVLRSVRMNRTAVCDRELDPAWAGIAAPVFGSGGQLVAAIEVRMPGPAGDAGTARTALGVAASCLSRDLAQHGIGASAPMSLAGHAAARSEPA